MRLHAARQLAAYAWFAGNIPNRVQVKIGITRYSAEPAEALAFAEAIIAAAAEARQHEECAAERGESSCGPGGSGDG